jgi:hypothetical protein
VCGGVGVLCCHTNETKTTIKWDNIRSKYFYRFGKKYKKFYISFKGTLLKVPEINKFILLKNILKVSEINKFILLKNILKALEINKFIFLKKGQI